MTNELPENPTEPVIVTDKNFKEALEKYPSVYVDFWAPWCGPCRMVGPIIEELAKEYEGKVAFLKLNVDEEQLTAAAFSVMSIPNMKIFKNGEEVENLIGAMPKFMIKEKIDKYL